MSPNVGTVVPPKYECMPFSPIESTLHTLYAAQVMDQNVYALMLVFSRMSAETYSYVVDHAIAYPILYFSSKLIVPVMCSKHMPPIPNCIRKILSMDSYNQNTKLIHTLKI